MAQRNPETFINWYRSDEPGENPKWTSKCGEIVQTKFGGETAEYECYINKRMTSTLSTLQSAKNLVEKAYIRTHPEEASPSYDSFPDLVLDKQ